MLVEHPASGKEAGQTGSPTDTHGGVTGAAQAPHKHGLYSGTQPACGLIW